jgi:hypothetical protein
MTYEDLKIAFINSLTLILSFSTLESWFKVALLAVTIGYTITKWAMLLKGKKNDKVED